MVSPALWPALGEGDLRGFPVRRWEASSWKCWRRLESIAEGALLARVAKSRWGPVGSGPQ